MKPKTYRFPFRSAVPKARLIDEGHQYTLNADRRRDQWIAASVAVAYTLLWCLLIESVAPGTGKANTQIDWYAVALMGILWGIPTAALLVCFVGPSLRVELRPQEQTCRLVSAWFGLALRSQELTVRSGSITVEDMLIRRQNAGGRGRGILLLLGLFLGPLGLLLALATSRGRRGTEDQWATVLHVTGPPVQGWDGFETGEPRHAVFVSTDAQPLRAFARLSQSALA